MMAVILIVGALAVLLLFIWSALQTAGRCSRAEEEAEQQRERSHKC